MKNEEVASICIYSTDQKFKLKLIDFLNRQPATSGSTVITLINDKPLDRIIKLEQELVDLQIKYNRVLLRVKLFDMQSNSNYFQDLPEPQEVHP